MNSLEKDLANQEAEKDPILDTRIGSPEGVVERLKTLIGNAPVYAKANEWGVPNSTIAAMISRGSKKLSTDIALKIADAEGVNLYWLASGKGPKRIDDIRHEEYREGGVVQLPDDFVLVNDMRSVEASAGSGAEVSTELVDGRMAFRRDWVLKEGLNPNALCIIRAKGDSMEPTIQDGAPLLVESFSYMDQQGNKHYIRHGRTPEEVVKQDGIYVVQLRERLVVKRLQLDMMGGLIVNSDNSAYERIHIPAEQLDDIVVIGRVVWTGRKL